MLSMKIKKVLPILFTSLLLTGCWDRVEIDKKAFVSTIAIDIGEDIKERDTLKTLKPTDPFAEKSLDILNVTYGFPDIRNMEQEKGTAEILPITVGGYSMTDAYFKALAESSRTLHFGHSKVLFLSDEIFRNPEVAKEVMDYIEREPSLNRTMTMAIVEGKAEDYVSFKPLMEENIENYMTGLMGNNSKNGSVYPVTLNKYLDMSTQNDVNMLPLFRLEEGNKKLVLAGITLIKDYEIVGYLNDKEVIDVQLLRGDIGSCKKVIYRDGHPIDYYIRDVATKVKMELVNDKLVLNYSIFTEGTIKGYFTEANLLDTEVVREIEGYFGKAMEKELVAIADMTRNELQVDILNVKEKLRKYHPRIWSQVQNRWPEIYENAEIKVTVDNHIRTVGLSN
ncbi:Ger(x)C family spore germination protein [Clostridium sp.]|uniref:Ger(x)C family spore germination protein n=1 Tax=Clostridium sp. TaxID=1506 RepID=UPI002FCC9D58